MKKIERMALTAVMFMAGATGMTAQDKVEATIQADIVNQYIWRGLDLGNPSIQPTLGIGYKGLYFGAWGNYGFTDSNDTKEFDLTLSYTKGGFSVGVTDYWFNQNGANPEYDGKYFVYNAHRTAHVFEAFLGYDFGPVSLNWYTNFAGNDGINKSGKRAYSSYCEINAPFKLATCDWNATLGFVPYTTSFYAGDKDYAGFSVTNVAIKATKDIKITDSFSLPLFASVIANPFLEKAYFVFGMTLKAF